MPERREPSAPSPEGAAPEGASVPPCPDAAPAETPDRRGRDAETGAPTAPEPPTPWVHDRPDRHRGAGRGAQRRAGDPLPQGRPR
jgi:hypothetical protein